MTFPNHTTFVSFNSVTQVQFRDLGIETLPSALKSLLSDEGLSKTLSVAYKQLFKKTPPAVAKCREKYISEVPEIQGEDWDDMWEQPFKHLVSARDKLIQFKFLHSICYTHARLANIYPTASTECWRCIYSPANAGHVFGPVNKFRISGQLLLA